MASYSNAIKKTAIPAWFNGLSEYPLSDNQYYKVTYKFIQAQHDGYCSGYDGESDADVEWITMTQVGYLPKQSWDFDTKKFQLKGSITCTRVSKERPCSGSACGACTQDSDKCYQSGYCGLWAKVQLESVELINS